jgi:antibiotic biosynthesis monooxygenase (ABM) superfamily enzyme
MMSISKKLLMKRLVVGWIALYPTLLVILFLLGGITHGLSMPLATLIEVIAIVPVTQLIAYPIAGKIFSIWLSS